MLPITPGMDALDVPLEVARAVGWVGLAAAALLVAAAMATAVLAAARRRPPDSRAPEAPEAPTPEARTPFRPPAPLPAAGLALAAAAMVAVGRAPDGAAVGLRQVTGVAAAAAAAWLGAQLGLAGWLRAALVLPGAVLTVDAMRITDRPAAVAPAAVAAAVLAVLAGRTDRVHAATAAGPPLLAVSVFGMYATVPETGQILPVLVVTVPVALVGGPVRLARLGTAGAAASVVLLVAIVAEGGQARPASIVGALASLGMLALDPVVRAVVPAAAPPVRWASREMAVFFGTHVVLVAVASRVAGLRGSGAEATLIVAAVGAVALAALARHMEHRRGQD